MYVQNSLLLSIIFRPIGARVKGTSFDKIAQTVSSQRQILNGVLFWNRCLSSNFRRRILLIAGMVRIVDTAVAVIKVII